MTGDTPSVQHAEGAASGFSYLTARHVLILGLVAEGLSNPQIGKELNLSRHTVAQHIMEMCKRTGSVNRTALVHKAHLSGVLSFR
jgi:DNA-binding NarL/FixJ family response regulator